jgi:hypothetical protein
MTTRARRRAATLQQLSDALYADARLAGAVLVGSGAAGFRDDESDIDLVAPVADGHDAALVFGDWKGRIGGIVSGRYLAATAATEREHLLVVHCDDRLEIDISFPPLGELAARAPRWRVLWERSGDVTQRLSALPPEAGIAAGQAYQWTLNRAVHRVTYAARALRRGQAWKAILQLDELRRFALELACLDLFEDSAIDPHIAALPPGLLDALALSLPARADVESARASLRACVDLLLHHAAALDRRHGLSRCEAVRALLIEHLTAQAGSQQ